MIENRSEREGNTIEIEEEIRYVRPALDSSVLGKRCDSEITFAPR
jgi:hypothetical protein